MRLSRRSLLGGTAAISLLGPVWAQSTKKYDAGASDTEIRLGHFCPYTGPAAAYGIIGKAHKAFWQSVNDAGGINGRKVTLISEDDGYDAEKAVAITKALVEQHNVLALFNPLGTDANTAIRGYLNESKVPQLFVSSGASKWGDPAKYPWTIGFQPDYRFEAAAYVKHAQLTVKDAKFGLLIQNDEFGADYESGVRDALGQDTGQLVIANYQVTGDENLEAQIAKLKDFGANVLINVSTPRFAVAAIKRMAALEWKPVHYLTNVSLSLESVMKPAGLENCQGIITAAYLKDPANPVWDRDPEMSVWRQFMDKYLPDVEKTDIFAVFAYAVGSLMKETLRRCGHDLTRDNLMRQAANLTQLRVPMLLPSIYVRTTPKDYYPVSEIQLSQFQGQIWQPLGGFTRNTRQTVEAAEANIKSAVEAKPKQ
jgi:branched-chain amino acid transport system substrate-binding protein